MVNLTGGGSKKDKYRVDQKRQKESSQLVSWIKWLGWEAGNLVRDASTAKKLQDAFSHVSYCDNIRYILDKNRDTSQLCCISRQIARFSAQSLNLTDWTLSGSFGLLLFFPPPDTWVRTAINCSPSALLAELLPACVPMLLACHVHGLHSRTWW